MLKLTLTITTALCASAALAQERTSLMEILTSTNCGQCVTGIIVGDQMSNTYSGNVLIVNLHADGMTPSGYISSTGLAGPAVGNIDRIVDDMPYCMWCLHVSSHIFNTDPPANVAVSRTYEPATRLLTVNVSAHFTSSPPAGDYRLGGIVVEDHITNGPPQVNAYSGTDTVDAGFFASMPPIIPGSQMTYDHVGRALLGGYDGVQGAIPPNPQAGQTYSHTFTYTIPQEYDANYVRVYGLLSNGATGEVLQAHASNYASGNTNQPPAFQGDQDTVRLVHGEYMSLTAHVVDPESDAAIMSAVGPLPAWANFTSGDNRSAHISGTPEQPGTYTFTFEATDEYCGTSSSRTLTVIVEPVYDPWIPMGTPGFTTVGSTSTPSLAVDPATSTVYSSNRSNDGKAKVHKWDGSAWSTVGNQYTIQGQPVITVRPDNGKPWVAAASAANAIKVVRYNGTSWVQVGDLVPAVDAYSIKFKSDGTVFLATGDGPQDMKVFTIAGSAWTALGGDVPITIPDVDNIGNIQMELTPAGDPVIAFAGHQISTDSTFIYAAQWNGSSWELLGGGTPQPHHNVAPFKFHVAGDGSIYLALRRPLGANVYKLNGAEWTLYCSTPEPWLHYSNYNYLGFDMCASDDGQIYINYKDEYSQLGTRVYDGSVWHSAGDHYDAEIGTMLMMPDERPVNVYLDPSESNRLTAKSLSDWTAAVEANEAIASAPLLYPNPTPDVIHFTAASSGPEDVRILDVAGKVVTTLRSTNGAIDVRELAPGTYMLQTLGTGMALRFVKQ